MAEYIERQAVLAKIDPDEYYHSNEIRDILRDIPDANVAPVRHGRWLNFYGDFSTAECELCSELYEVSPDESPKKEFFDAFKGFYKFCPNCGARMDGQEEPQKEDRNRT